jgi:hypothetical protein
MSALDVSIYYADTADPQEALFVVMDYPASKTSIFLVKREISGQLNDWS